MYHMHWPYITYIIFVSPQLPLYDINFHQHHTIISIHFFSLSFGNHIGSIGWVTVSVNDVDIIAGFSRLVFPWSGTVRIPFSASMLLGTTIIACTQTKNIMRQTNEQTNENLNQILSHPGIIVRNTCARLHAANTAQYIVGSNSKIFIHFPVGLAAAATITSHEDNKKMESLHASGNGGEDYFPECID